MAKRKNVAKPDAGAPEGHREDEPFLPELWCSREPKTPEEAAKLKRWKEVWADLFAENVLEEIVKDRKRAAPSTAAAVYALIRYAEEALGLEEVSAEDLLHYASSQGWPDAERINPRSFAGLLKKAQQAARDARQGK